ncbi:hypothetical protein [Nocardioides ultimimeridianus]
MTTAAVATVVGVAEPAHAVTSCTTSTVIDEGGKTSNHVMTWGDYEAVHVNVTATCSDGHTYAGAGTVTVQQSTNGGSTWTTVSPTYTNSAYWSRYTTNWIKQTSMFRAVYSGGSDGTYSYGSSSDSITIGLIRHTKQASGKSVRGGYKIKFAISPAASIKGLHVTFQVKNSGVWKFYKRLQVSQYGTVTTTFAGSRAGRVYRMLLPGGRGFLASRYGNWTITLY